MAISVVLDEPPGWYLCYVDDPTRPATGGGIVLAYPQRYLSRVMAAKAALRLGLAEFVHPVEVQ